MTVKCLAQEHNILLVTPASAQTQTNPGLSALTYVGGGGGGAFLLDFLNQPSFVWVDSGIVQITPKVVRVLWV